jgi:Zn-dependent protease
VYLAADASGSRVWLAVAYSGFVINLFNLIPMAPFDGGRITAVLGPRIWFLGVPILLALFLYWPSPMLLLVALLAAPQLMAAWRYDPNAPEAVAYYGVAPAVRWRYATSYVGLAAFLALMTFQVHERVQAGL